MALQIRRSQILYGEIIRNKHLKIYVDKTTISVARKVCVDTIGSVRSRMGNHCCNLLLQAVLAEKPIL